ncbi:MAG: histidine kinase [Saprospiraceae bacterium]|nr:histidine kinase [Saprospiraceae bacterium]
MGFTRLYLFYFLLFYSLLASAQDIGFEQFSDRDGLPSMKTYNVFQDSSGLMWIGTENGLVSFDGDEFERYTHPDLLDNDIVRAGINRKGKIYFQNLSGQLGIIENGKMELIELPDIPKGFADFALRKDKDYLLGMPNRDAGIDKVWELDGKKVKLVSNSRLYFDSGNENIYEILGKNKYLCLTDSSVYNWDENIIEGKRKAFVRSQQLSYHRVLLVDQKLKDRLKDNFYQRLLEHKGDNFIIKGSGIIYYNSKNGEFLPFFDNISVNTIFFDVEGNAWITTRSRGLLRVSNLLFKLNQRRFTIGKGINAIHKSKLGNIYLGTIFSEIIINPFEEKKSIQLTDRKRQVSFVESNGIVIGYEEMGISIINDMTLKYSTFHDRRYSNKALLLNDSTVYAFTRSGISIYDKNGFIQEPDRHNTFLINVRMLSAYKQSSLSKYYAGSTQGLFRADFDSLKFVKVDALKSYSITSITGGRDTSLWIGTRTKGVFKLKNDSIVDHIDVALGLISNNVNKVFRYENELQISTNSGLCIFNIDNRTFKIINSYNFLPSDEVLVCKIINDEYWVGTIEGLTILTQQNVNELSVKGPLLSLKEVIVNGVSKEYLEGMRLNYTENNVQINFQNISFSSGKDKKIKYRITNIDTSWISTSDAYIRMPTLKPGKYALEAIGINSIGLESEPIFLNFEIDLPWWNTIWAMTLGALMLIGIVYLIVMYRSRRVRKEEKTKREYLTQINKIKDQALQLQMNPHFIFNSLNAIQGFIGTDEEEKAMNYLARFARLIRMIFEYSKGRSITLEEELDFLTLYLDLEKLRFKEKVDISVQIDDELDQNRDMVRIPPLLIQPIVENAFKHGLFHKKGKGHLKISFKSEDNLLKIIIEDDGIGREQAKRIGKNKDDKHISSGIKTTKERINLLNFAQKNKSNKIWVEDLMSDDDQPNGTRVTIALEILN